MPTTSKYDRPIKAPWQPLEWGYPFAPRSVALPAPTAGIFDEPCYCLKINAAWVGHFVGVIQALLEDDAWIGNDDAKYAAQQQIELFLAQFGDDMGCKTIFRQNPTNDCQLQYSTDNGDTWVLAFDYGLCTPPSNSSQDYLVYQNFSEIVNQYNSDWNENPTLNNFAPETVYDGSAADDGRNAALCYTLGVFYDSIQDYSVEVIENPEGRPIFEIVIGVVLGIAAAYFTAGVAAPAVAGLIGGLVSQLGAAAAGLPFGFLANATENDFIAARDAVICCMFQAIAGSNVEQTDFKTSLDNCNFESGSPEERVSNVLTGLMQDLNLYLSFLKLWAETVDLEALGYPLPECPCETPATTAWCVEFDFTTSQHGWIINGGNYGTWISGTGFVGANVNESGVYSKRVYIRSTIDARVITSIEPIFDWTKGTYTPTGTYWALAINDNSDTIPNYNTPAKLESVMVNGNNQALLLDYPDLERTQVRLDMRASRMTTSPPNGAITLKKLRVTGMGQKPSQWASAADCSELCRVWNFVTSQNAPDWEIGWGTYSAGVNTATGLPPSSGVYNVQARIIAELGNLLTINSVEVTFDLTKGNYANGSVGALAVFGSDEDGIGIYSSVLAQSTISNGTDIIRTFTVNTANIKTIRIDLNSAGTTGGTPANPGAGKIKSVKIRYAGSEIWQNGVPC